MTQVPDLAILGGGSAGYATALRAAQLGLDVTLVEEDELGGTCLHRGCVPTKAWLQAAKTRATVAKADRLGIGAATVKTHVSALLEKFQVRNRVQLAVAVAECQLTIA